MRLEHSHTIADDLLSMAAQSLRTSRVNEGPMTKMVTGHPQDDARPAASSGPTTAPTAARVSKLDRLTSLRGFAALYVFIFHLERAKVFRPHWPITLGYTGVVFFFVLSGFVLTWSHVPGRKRRDFYLRRLSKIWPMHLVTTAAAYMLPVNQAAKSVLGAILTTTLTQAWMLKNGMYTYPGNAPSWTLSCELFFYLCFPLLIVAMLRLSERMRWLMAGGWFAITGAFTYLATHYSVDGQNLAYHFPLTRSSEFVLGIAAALAMRGGRRIALDPIVAFGLVIIAMAMGRHQPSPEVNVLLTVPFLLFISTVAASEISDSRGGGHRVLRWLQWRPLVYCGEVSFAFYLVHALVIDNLVGPWHLTGVKGIAVLTVICVILSITLHHLVEKPAMKWLVERFSSRRPQTASAGLTSHKRE